MVCLRNICINTLHKGDSDDYDDDDDNNNNNKYDLNASQLRFVFMRIFELMQILSVSATLTFLGVCWHLTETDLRFTLT
jgi:hypothetical protein